MKQNENDNIIKCFLYNKDGTIDYVFDNAKLDEIIAPFVNKNDTERDRGKILFLSSSLGDTLSRKSLENI